MKGLYFYKLVSPYKEDVTKDCKLTINEIDSNFITLKDADIKSVEFDEVTNKLNLIKNDGDVLSTSLAALADGVTHNLSVDYDKLDGKVTVKYDNKTVIIDGLITEDNISSNVLKHVNVDSTLKGNGTTKKPLGIKETEETGQFKPCIKYLNVINGETLPNHPRKGERYVTKEYVSDYGYLYDFKSVRLISQDLTDGWRIPSKEDWDNMLNAIEPCEKDRNHNSLVCNKEFGKIAGSLLKAKHRWFEENHHDCECTHNIVSDEEFEVEEDGNFHYNKSHSFEHHPHHNHDLAHGVDAYGMRLLPAGYGDGCRFFDYFGKRSGFWTSSMVDNTDVYVKRFDFNKSGVVQTAESPNMIFSLRLVKDYDGSNFNEVEFINGQSYSCVLMPSLNSKTGFAVWTAANIAFDDCKYSPKHTYVGDTHNCGEDAYTELVSHYFTAEWDGHKWLKKVIREGESVVIFKGKHENSFEYDEYRLIKGHLVSVSGKLYYELSKKFDKIIDEVNDKFDTEIKERQEADDELSAKTEDLQDQVDILSGDVETLFESVSAITDDIENLKAVDEVLSGAIEDLQTALSAETEERIAADEVLSGAIDTLDEELRNEIEERIASDIVFSGAIDTLNEELQKEAEERIAADEALSEALSAETETRIEADEKLFERLVSGGTYDSVNGVLTLVTENPDLSIDIQFNGNFGNF